MKYALKNKTWSYVITKEGWLTIAPSCNAKKKRGEAEGESRFTVPPLSSSMKMPTSSPETPYLNPSEWQCPPSSAVHFSPSISPTLDWVCHMHWSLSRVWHREGPHQMPMVDDQHEHVWRVREAARHSLGPLLLPQPVSLLWGRWRLETMRVVHRSSLGNCHHRWSWPSRSLFQEEPLAIYDDSIISHFKRKISPNLWPFCDRETWKSSVKVLLLTDF